MEGRAHAYLFASKGLKRWDSCAPEAILTAIGGKFTDLYGNFYEYNKNVDPLNKFGVLATAKGVDHLQYLSKIPEDVRNAL